VMLTINQDVEAGLVNGSRGVVKSISKDERSSSPRSVKDYLLDEYVITVKFMSGRIETISKHEFKIEDDDRTYVRVGFPLKVCFAITFHKVQGLTLDCVYIDIGSSIFCAGQAYVGLSRCKNLDSLYLRSFYPKKVYPNKTALRFDESMQDSSRT
jgi:ATP-dependent exoDNAse (exonuclease V) alpha subunit